VKSSGIGIGPRRERGRDDQRRSRGPARRRVAHGGVSRRKTTASSRSSSRSSSIRGYRGRSRRIGDIQRRTAGYLDERACHDLGNRELAPCDWRERPGTGSVHPVADRDV